MGQRGRGTRVYDKPPMTLDELVQRLMERGLLVPDQPRARRYLRHIGYYRLSPYAIPFQHEGPEHLFRPGVSFDDLLGLYVFDRSLRLLVMDALERIEVAVRAALTDHMATSTDDAHWYADARHFRDRRRHQKLLHLIRETSDQQLRRPPGARPRPPAPPLGARALPADLRRA